jgi:hypothetical protein
MLTNSDVLNLIMLESEFCAAVESRTAAREAANSAEFRYRATAEVCEHAINLKRALGKNRFHEDEGLYSPFHHRLMKMQQETQVVYRDADAAYELAHKTAQKSFYALQDARKTATLSAPEENKPGAPDELELKDI